MNYLLHSHLKPGIAYRRKANVTKGQHAGEKRQAVSGMCYLNHADHLDKRRALNMTAEQTNKAFFSGCQSRLRQLGLGAAPGADAAPLGAPLLWAPRTEPPPLPPPSKRPPSRHGPHGQGTGDGPNHEATATPHRHAPRSGVSNTAFVRI